MANTPGFATWDAVDAFAYILYWSCGLKVIALATVLRNSGADVLHVLAMTDYASRTVYLEHVCIVWWRAGGLI